jgi:hypothetical protein
VRLLALRARQDSSHWQFQRLQERSSSSAAQSTAIAGELGVQQLQCITNSAHLEFASPPRH